LSSGTFEIRLRPIRFAVIIKPNSVSALRKAIELNSSVWGGIRNPIFPYFRKTPSEFLKGYYRRIKYQDYIGEMLKAFDIDFIVAIDTEKSALEHLMPRRVLGIDDIIHYYNDELIFSNCVSVPSLVDSIAGQGMRFSGNKPIKLLLPTFSNEDTNILFALIGYIPANIASLLDQYEGDINIVRENISLDSFGNYYFGDTTPPLGLTNYQLSIRPQDRFSIRPSVFYLNSDNLRDILHFWNLRAAGVRLFPFPASKLRDKNFLDHITRFVNSHYYSFRGANAQDIPMHVNVLASPDRADRQVTRQAVDALIQNEPLLKEKLIMSSYPRLWENWARNHTGENCATISVGDNKVIEIDDLKRPIETKCYYPNFLTRHTHTRFANVITFSIRSADHNLTSTLPDEHIDTLHLFESFDFHGRISPNGITLYPHGHYETIRLTIPGAEATFRELMKFYNFPEFQISAEGRLVTQLYHRIGGFTGIMDFTDEPFIKLLVKVKKGEKDGLQNETERVVERRHYSQKQIIDSIKKMLINDPFRKDRFEEISQCLINKYFKLGIVLSCELCGQTAWYEIKGLDYQVQCKCCLGYFPFPFLKRNNDREWRYIPYGSIAFNRGNLSIFTPLLTLGYFTGLAEYFLSPPTFLFGMQMVEANRQPRRELDLCLIYAEHTYSPNPKRILAVECKAYNYFESKDLERLDYFRKKIRDAILVLATLSRQLSRAEKKIIAKYVYRLRRMRKMSDSKANLLILTGNELFSNLMKHDWVNDQGYEDKLDMLCEHSQVKYLGIKSHQQEIVEEIEAIRARQIASKNDAK